MRCMHALSYRESATLTRLVALDKKSVQEKNKTLGHRAQQPCAETTGLAGWPLSRIPM